MTQAEQAGDLLTSWLHPRPGGCRRDSVTSRACRVAPAVGSGGRLDGRPRQRCGRRDPRPGEHLRPAGGGPPGGERLEPIEQALAQAASVNPHRNRARGSPSGRRSRARRSAARARRRGGGVPEPASIPVTPSSMNSAGPPRPRATRAMRGAIASSRTSPNGSGSDVSTRMSIRRSRGPRRDLAGELDRPGSPSPAISPGRDGRAGERPGASGPTISVRISTPRSRSSRGAGSSRSWPFQACRRPTSPMSGGPSAYLGAGARRSRRAGRHDERRRRGRGAPGPSPPRLTISRWPAGEQGSRPG